MSYQDIFMPTLIEVLKYAEDDPDYWGRFGFKNLKVPADCPLTVSVMPRLTERFNQKYKFKMLGMETMEVWQAKLQDRFDDNVHRFERGMKLYADNQAAMAVILGTVEEYTGTDTASGDDITRMTGKVTNKGSYTDRDADTPDTAINVGDDYASSISKGDHAETDTRSGDTTMTHGRVDDRVHTLTRTDNTLTVDSVQTAIDHWHDLETEFIKSFSDLFMGVFNY